MRRTDVMDNRDDLRSLVKLQMESLLTEASAVGDTVKGITAAFAPVRVFAKKIDNLWDKEKITHEVKTSIFDKLDTRLGVRTLVNKHLKSLDQDSRVMIARELGDYVYDSFGVVGQVTAVYNDWYYDVKAKNPPAKSIAILSKAVKELNAFLEETTERAEEVATALQPEVDAALQKTSKKKDEEDEFLGDVNTFAKQARKNPEVVKGKFDSLLSGVVDAFSNPTFAATMNDAMKVLRSTNDFGPLFSKVPALQDVANTFYAHKGDFSPESISAYLTKRFKKYMKDVMSSKNSLSWIGARDVNSLLNDMSVIPGVVNKVVNFVEKDAERLEKSAEAPAKAPLGRIAFPGDRKGKPMEVDTDVEKRLYNALMLHYVDNEEVTNEDAALMRKFLSKEWYSEIFHEPTAKVVYRGFSVSKNWKWLLRVLKVDKLPKDKGSIEKNFTYTPSRTATSSWSTSKKVARDFAEGGDRGMSVIFHASVADNPGRFVAGPGGLYKVQGFEQYDSEKEAIGLGPIKVFKVEWNANY